MMNIATQTRSDLEVVTFRLNEQEFCLNILSVREIRGWTQATVVPHSPSFVLGVINLRGTVLPIIDLAARLKMPVSDPTTRHVIIVVQVHKHLFGLLVDGVSDILSVPDESIQAAPDIVTDANNNFVRSVIMIDGRMISMIAVEDILPSSEREAA